VATLPFGPQIPLRPFFGIMGVAPPPAYGAISSIEPREHGGNIDNKELGVGAIVYFPVHVPGALFSVGDGHAVQGDGEVDLSALETSLTGVFRLTLHAGIEASLPFAITQRHVITMGFDEDLDEAARKALREMIQLIGRATGWPHASAYAFCSMACDLRITQMVDGEKGVHAMVEHSLLTPHLSKPYLALKPQSPDA
jgi:acetamidase/formamidase